MGRLRRVGLVGNGWVLAGAVLYLMELPGIIWAGMSGVDFVPDASPSEVMTIYMGNENVARGLAGWFAVVLLGRILLFIGLRRALADSGRSHLLLDFAVAAAAVSVTLEIASYGLAATASAPANAGNEALAVLVNQSAGGLGNMVGGGLGVAIVCATYVMWRSRLFSRPLILIGAISGIAIVVGQLSIAPSLQPLADILSYAPFLFWIWALWAGVLCLRARTARPAVVAVSTNPA